LDELEASRQAGGPHWREATDALGFVGRVGSGNGTLRTLRRSNTHMDLSRTMAISQCGPGFLRACRRVKPCFADHRPRLATLGTSGLP